MSIVKEAQFLIRSGIMIAKLDNEKFSEAQNFA